MHVGSKICTRVFLTSLDGGKEADESLRSEGKKISCHHSLSWTLILCVSGIVSLMLSDALTRICKTFMNNFMSSHFL